MAFIRWFGQSKIVDKNGTPKVVYHGTRADFDVFRPKARNPALGFHFGSILQAEFFAGYCGRRRPLRGGTILPCYLRIENPLRTPDVFDRGPAGADEVAHLLVREGVLEKAVRDRVYKARSTREAYDRIVVALGGAGYDGIIYANVHEGGTANTNEDSYVVFEPEQIKSVFNCGAFDAARPNILA
ncbi:MAG: hypothetical protein EPO27_02155 [Betaproteobacteria bacterium]|nr:MAG: hypothetical protein EPO27_02155 [Betaproteobacteria bacterium]